MNERGESVLANFLLDIAATKIALWSHEWDAGDVMRPYAEAWRAGHAGVAEVRGARGRRPR